MTNYEYILDKTNLLVKKYSTRDPFQLCKELNIHIWYRDLGDSLKAFYFYHSRMKYIVINEQVEEPMNKVLCAHELGHAILHGQLATMKSFQELKLFESITPTEYEANLFAAELLIDDNTLIELLNNSDTFFNIASELSVPKEILDFKFRLLKAKGYNFNIPITSKHNFLKDN